jgi:hypothetical protein
MTDLTPQGTSHRRSWPTLLSAFAAYAALAGVITFPLVLNLPTRLPKDLGDPLLVTSILWWNAQIVPLTQEWWNGFGFFPATGMMAFSDHFLGASVIASPLQWLGFGPITAYNLTLLASFPLCAIAAHALALTLTGRHDAAVVCGLAYGFNPYRVAHIEHLELLLAFGMPAALAALHLYAGTRRVKWLVVFTAALTLQVLSTSYYAVFFTVLLGLWTLWFMRPQAWRAVLAMVAAAGVAALVVSPIILGYHQIHDRYNLTRDFVNEVVGYSADLSSFVTASSLSALWGWTAVLNGGERQLFPGLTITVLALAGVVLLRRSHLADRDRLAMVSAFCWVMAAGLAAVAVGARVTGPWNLDWGWLSVSGTAPHKTLSLSAALSVIAVALSPTMRAEFRVRSALAFYLVAAAILFVCSLGPRPALLGEQILYEPPYAWLMRLPFFGDAIRVPARFGMLAILALSVAAGLAFNRLTLASRPKAAVLLLVITGIVAEVWMRDLPLPIAPRAAFDVPVGDRSAAVMELPLGDVWRDTAAMYRATRNRLRGVNGYNGYEPPYYQVLRRALDERDPTVLDALAAFGPLLIAADNRVDRDQPWASFLSSHPDAQRVSDVGNRTLFRLPLKPRPLQIPCESRPLAIAAVFDEEGQLDLAPLTDQDPTTQWMTAHPQRAGDALTVDLGRVEPVCGIRLSMGSAAVLYPGTLRVATSLDNVTWKTRFERETGGSALRAALRDPVHPSLVVPLSVKEARFIRLQIVRSQPEYPWAVANIIVDGS